MVGHAGLAPRKIREPDDRLKRWGLFGASPAGATTTQGDPYPVWKSEDERISPADLRGLGVRLRAQCPVPDRPCFRGPDRGNRIVLSVPGPTRPSRTPP